MRTEEKKFERPTSPFLDPESDECKRLMDQFDEKTMEPKRFADVRRRMREATAPAEEK